MCGERAGAVDLQVYGGSTGTGSYPFEPVAGKAAAPQEPGHTQRRGELVGAIVQARDEFAALHGIGPTHVGIPDSHRMDLVSAIGMCGLKVVWLDHDAHGSIMVWRQAGAVNSIGLPAEGHALDER